MGRCKAGLWCIKCKNSIEMKNCQIFFDYKAHLPEFATYYTQITLKKFFDTGYVCKKAIKEMCEELEEK